MMTTKYSTAGFNIPLDTL